ncbi:MAG TPA: DinB family protein [Anaerolineales bacterium]|nr:DinB family protein [Anaerolineales bacterium]
MNLDIASIHDPRVRIFYSLYWPQHLILRDFFSLLQENQFDYSMTEIPERKADTPRESLAHILYVQLVYLNGVKTGKLEFKSMGVEHYTGMPREQLLTEMDRVDEALFKCLTSNAFDSNNTVDVPWGGSMNAIDLLFFLRDHDILHIGWNLALMDHLNVPRYDSLIRYWGP